MNDNSIAILPEEMQAIARYEITFDQLMGGFRFTDVTLEFAGSYQMTLDDLHTALQNILAKNPTVQQFIEHWYYPLTELEAIFGIDIACRYSDEDEESDSYGTEELVKGLPMKESDLFSSIWVDLEDIWLNEDAATRLADIALIHELIEDANLFFENCDKPLLERAFTDHQKESYIHSFADETRAKEASELEVAICRSFTDELCSRDNEVALRLKGYSSYGGNRLYECDWQFAKASMTRLLEKTDNPSYANTLGHLYYDGRCSNGVPDYGKAFEMFSISAANGIHDGICMLADLYHHGYGCRKSDRTAKNLYERVYNICFEEFLNGSNHGSFADAALRMGNVYLEGIGTKKSPEAAYRFYLQAEFAASIRTARSRFSGGADVAANIRKAMEAARGELPEGFFQRYQRARPPWFFWAITEDGYRAEISIKPVQQDRAIVLVSRRPKRDEDVARPFLLTLPQLNFCSLVSEVKVDAFGIRASFVSSTEGKFRYDTCEWNHSERRLEFYSDDDFVGWISCEEYRIPVPERKAFPFGRRS
ncbi:MAG: sel1 repeat family protein [Oscillospiraceae bacterium]|nr:sel1 repeat family protein [Oscillospiraceae bacterium]